jgi:hypothetical protein
MPVRRLNIDALKLLRADVPLGYKPRASEVIRLYEDRKIKQIGTATSILKQLAGKRTAPQTAIARINKYKQVEPATGEIARQRRRQAEFKTFFVSGKVMTTTNYFDKKSKQKHQTIYKDTFPRGVTVRAKTAAEARDEFQQMMEVEFQNDGYEKERQVVKVSIDSVKEEGDFQAQSEHHQPMREAQPVDYDFIPSDDSYCKHTGMCVEDTLLGIYSPLKKSFTKKRMRQLAQTYYNSFPKNWDKAREMDPFYDGVDETQAEDYRMGTDKRLHS